MAERTAPAADTPERRAFYERIGRKHLTPLWLSLANLVTHEPTSGCQPASWSFADIREAMIEAGGLITAKEAERRVLILENPGLRGQSKITTDLYAGVQLVLPGEIAPAHKHTQSALRFVLEGNGAHTAVNGEKTEMHEGDFVITPPLAWHDHSNESSQPIFWLDGLDIPLVQFLDASFADHHDEDEQPISRPEGDSIARYGQNLLPVNHVPAPGGASPVFSYPYSRTRETLEQLRRTGPWDACHGLKMRYINPATGGYPMATIGAFIQLLPRGLQDRAVPFDRWHRVRRHGRARPHAHRRRFRRRVAAARDLRRAQLEARRARSGRGCGPVLVLRPSRAGSAASLPRGTKQWVSARRRRSSQRPD